MKVFLFVMLLGSSLRASDVSEIQKSNMNKFGISHYGGGRVVAKHVSTSSPQSIDGETPLAYYKRTNGNRMSIEDYNYLITR